MLLVLAAISGVATATPTRDHPVEDTAQVVPDSEEPSLETELRALRAETGVALGVMVIKTTGDATIEKYARARGSEWSEGAAPAALFVLAVADRRSRLEVNDALRDRFPDSRAQAILDNLKGYLRSADYPAAVRAVMREVRNGASGMSPDLESPHPQSAGSATAAPTTPTTPTTPTYTPTPYSYTPVTPTTTDVPSTREREPDDSNTAVLLAVLFGVALFVFIACMWARDRIASRATISSHGPEARPSLFAETLTCMGLILVGVLYFALAALAASASESSSSSSSDWGSSGTSGSSGSSSSGSSGGWSGGGASSSW